MAVMADPVEQRLLQLENDVLILNRSLQGNSRLGRALRPADSDEWFGSRSPSLGISRMGCSLPASSLEQSAGYLSVGSAEQVCASISRCTDRLDEERRLREELQRELQGRIAEVEGRVDDVQVKMTKAVQRLSAAQAALQEHCAELAVQTEVALQEHGSSLIESLKSDKESSPMEQLRRSLAAAEARFEGRCAQLESRVAAMNVSELLDARFADIKAMVRKHCAAMQEHLVAEQLSMGALTSSHSSWEESFVGSPRKAREHRLHGWNYGEKADKAASPSLTSQETASTLMEDEKTPSARGSVQACGADLAVRARSLGLAELLDRVAEVQAVQAEGEGRRQLLEARLDEMKPNADRLDERLAAVEAHMRDGLRKQGSEPPPADSLQAVEERLTLRLDAMEASCEGRWSSLEAQLESRVGGVEVSLDGRCGKLEAQCERRCASLDAKLESQASSLEASSESRCSLLEAQCERRCASLDAKLESQASSLEASSESRCSLLEASLEARCSGLDVKLERQVSSLEASLDTRCRLLEAKVGSCSVAETIALATDKLNDRITLGQALTEKRCSQVETQVSSRQGSKSTCDRLSSESTTSSLR